MLSVGLASMLLKPLDAAKYITKTNATTNKFPKLVVHFETFSRETHLPFLC